MEGGSVSIPEKSLSLMLEHICQSSGWLLGVCRSVNRAWRDAADQAADTMFVSPLRELCSLLLLQSEIIGRKKARVEFLDATLALIMAWDAPILGHIKVWRLICTELKKSLTEAFTFILENSELNETFDIFELTLRRYWQNVAALHCVHTQDSVSDCISDADARQVWIARFGAKRSFVSWPLFCEVLVSKKKTCGYYDWYKICCFRLRRFEKLPSF
jgi:hypothetical protein